MTQFKSTGGISKDVEQFFSTTRGITISDPGFSFATTSAAKSLTNWATGLQEVDTTLGVIPLNTFRATRSTEGGTIEPVSETDGFGANFIGAFNPPALTVYMSSNPDDFNELIGVGNMNCRVFLHGENNEKRAYVTSSGTLKGFSCNLTAVPVGITGSDNRGNKTQQYMLVLNFNNPDEWTKSIVWNDNISIEEYLEEMPIGYKAEISTALSTTSMSVLIYKRNDITNLSSDTWTVEYGDYNAAADRSISVGALSAAGVSELTIYGTGTTALAAGQYIKFRLVTKTGDVYDKMTNWITAKALV